MATERVPMPTAVGRATLACLLATACVAAGQETNLLPNPGFEQGQRGAVTGWVYNTWQPLGNAPARGEVADADGGRCLHVVGGGAGAHGYWSTTGLTARAGRRYVVSVRVRTRLVLDGAFVRLHLGFRDAAGEIIADQEHPFYAGWAHATLTGSADWTELALATEAPPGTATAGVTVRLVGHGEAWFDDARMVDSATAPAPAPPPELARSCRLKVPATAAGRTPITFTFTNPYREPVTGLRIGLAGGAEGVRADPVTVPDLAPGAQAGAEMVVAFPEALSRRGVVVEFRADYQVAGQARQAVLLGRFDVLPAYLIRAVREGAWGAVAATAPAGAPAIELLGTVTGAGQAAAFQPRTEPLRLPDRELGVVVQLNGSAATAGAESLRAELLDYFWRPAEVSGSLALAAGQVRLERLAVPASQLTRLRQTASQGGASTWRLRLWLARGAERLAETTVDLPLASLEPAAKALPALPESRDEVPPFGPLRLLDRVECGDDADPHPFREGGKGLHTKYTSEPIDYYGGGRRLNFDWQLGYRDQRERFSEEAEILGRRCRTASDWGWFAYLIGRGQVKPGAWYALVIDYPEDVSRNALVWNALCGAASFGWHTGGALGDPYTRQRFMQRCDLPLSGRFEQWTSVFRAQSGGSGWLALHSMGQRAAPFQAGLAASRISLYEIGDEAAVAKLAVPAEEPPGARRQFGFVQEDAAPQTSDLTRYAFYGYNVFAPLALSYGGGTYQNNSGYVDWPSRLFGPDGLRNPHAAARPGYYRVHGSPTRTEEVLKQAPARGLEVVPVFEYAGTGRLPPEALAVWPDQSPHHYHWGTTVGPDGLRTTRYMTEGTCLDMAHPAVGEDLEELLTEFATAYAASCPALKGVLLTPRFLAWQISYSPFELQRFAAETGLALPAGSAAEQGAWVQANHQRAFREYHYRHKRDNFLRAAAALRRVRSDLRLYLLNYNAGDDNLPFGGILYFWDREHGDELLTPGTVSLPDLGQIDLTRLLEDFTRPDMGQALVGMNPPLYRQDRGLVNLAPVHYPFTAGNRDYLEFFRTGEGLAVCDWWIYNEDAFQNHAAPGWNCPGLNGNEAAGPYCLLDEVLATAHGDPLVLTSRIGAANRGFPLYVRAFARAYRALPAVTMPLVPGAVADPEVFVRRVTVGGETYLSVINTGLARAGKDVRLRLPELTAGRVLRDLGEGRDLTCEAGGLALHLSPISLRTFRIAAP